MSQMIYRPKASDGDGLSSQLWKNFPTEEILGLRNRNVGIGIFDDFLGFGFSGAISTANAWACSEGGAYQVYTDSDAGLNALPGLQVVTHTATSDDAGVIVLEADSDDNDCTIIQAGNGLMMPFNVIHATGKDLIFETRFKVSAITASCTDIFIGLAGTGAAANSGVQTDNSATLASNNFLGFTRKAATTSGLTFTVQRTSGTEQEHADVGTLVADTYTKCGFRWNKATGICSIWQDGVKTHEVTHAQTAATPWPTLFMNFCAEAKYQATASHDLSIDWWACAQLV